ncbi:hypothetical protein CJD50_06370 [Hafnia paralvei]|uniref:Flippase n=2 Tax=Hafnia TaxID=568 RepID=A0A2A2MEI7_9GAMM|nr:oligosaccharide flippase family protein [Hafnia paralvei]ANF30121.1 putative O-antigen transporter [Hafnia alvei]PAV97281.1 hypothetical protein CJD50_06370 [Hafnia paralvei]TBL52971.1 hypothetical protein EYZ00_13045 [Hafnia paralvei]
MNKTIKNFFNLSLLQFITMIVQLMVYPYLIEHIGTEIYGEIIFQQLILFHLQMVVIFGTDLTAVRRVSKNIRSKAKLSILFSTITIGRVYIATAISIVYALYVFYSGSSYYYLYFCFLLFESAFTTKWYFHGRQELSKFTIPFSIFKFSGVFLIFFFVHTSSDWPKIIIINVATSIFSVIISFAMVFNSIRFRFIKLERVYKEFRLSYSLFITNLISVIKDRSGGIFIGIILGPTYVVYYDFCLKITGVISAFTSSISAAIYPKLSGDFDFRLFDKINIKMFYISLLPIIISIFFTRELIYVFQYAFHIDLSSIENIAIMFSLMIFVRSHGYYIGLCFLMAHDKRKEYTSSLILSGVIYIVLLVLLVLFKIKSMYLLAAAISISLIIEYVHRFYCYRKARFIIENS